MLNRTSKLDVLISERHETLEEKNNEKQIGFLVLSAFLGLSLAVAAPQDSQATPNGTAQQQTASGQENHGGRKQMDPNRRVKMLAKRLNLTQDQQQQLLPILTEEQQNSMNVRNDSSLTPQERKDKMMSIRKDGEAKVKGVLTGDQQQKYDKMQEKMRGRRRGNGAQDNSASSGSNQ